MKEVNRFALQLSKQTNGRRHEEDHSGYARFDTRDSRHRFCGKRDKQMDLTIGGNEKIDVAWIDANSGALGMDSTPARHPQPGWDSTYYKYGN